MEAIELAGPWTHFWDMHSGGGQKLAWGHVFIQADEENARKMFAEAFSRDPEHMTCDCCGNDYVISEEPDLTQATGFHRHLRHVAPLSDDGWRDAPLEERRACNEVSRYIEPDEPIPVGWFEQHANLRRGDPMPLADFLADPHFESFGRRIEVMVLPRPLVAAASAPTEDPT